MKVAVLGLWHLGCVTAACAARHFDVVGIEFDPEALVSLRNGRAPLSEPGLDELIQSGLRAHRLRFTDDVRDACNDADLLWVTCDTPVDEDDRSDIEYVLRQVRQCVPALRHGTLVLISSQLPVGTCRQLENEFKAGGYRFACSPENLRLGSAIENFTQPDRVIVGHRDARSREELQRLLTPFTSEIIWIRPESAEMAKHSINAFLALSICFMNEIARICEATGADAKEVERALKSERRIGPRAYLAPGGAFAGGTLARDIVTLSDLGDENRDTLELIRAIKRSNDHHREWALHKIAGMLAGKRGRIVLLGLTYKPGTNTLRRSAAIELARALSKLGHEICAIDPSLEQLPPELGFLHLIADAEVAVDGADALIVCTEWPEFRRLDWPALLPRMRSVQVIDAARFLEKFLPPYAGMKYISVGSPS